MTQVVAKAALSPVLESLNTKRHVEEAGTPYRSKSSNSNASPGLEKSLGGIFSSPAWDIKPTDKETSGFFPVASTPEDVGYSALPNPFQFAMRSNKPAAIRALTVSVLFQEIVQHSKSIEAIVPYL